MSRSDFSVIWKIAKSIFVNINRKEPAPPIMGRCLNPTDRGVFFSNGNKAKIFDIILLIHVSSLSAITLEYVHFSH